MSTKENKETRTTTTFYIIMGMSTALLLAVPVLVLMGVGYFADMFFHTKPFYMLLGIFLGLIGGTMNVFKLLQAMQKRKQSKTITP